MTPILVGRSNSGTTFTSIQHNHDMTHFVSNTTSATIAFSKSQTLAVSDVPRDLQHADVSFITDIASMRLSPSQSPRMSIAPVEDVSVARPQEVNQSEYVGWYGESPFDTDIADYSSTDHLHEDATRKKTADDNIKYDKEDMRDDDVTGYQEYNEFEMDEESPLESANITGRISSYNQLMALVGDPTSGSPTSTLSAANPDQISSQRCTTPDTSPWQPIEEEEHDPSDVSQLKTNLSSRLCYNMTACSCQIWGVHTEMTTLLSKHVAVAVCDLLLQQNTDMRQRFRDLTRAVMVPMALIDGKGEDVEKKHKLEFTAIRNDTTLMPMYREIRRMFTSQFNSGEVDIHDDFPVTSYLTEHFYRTEELEESSPSAETEEEPWICENERCGKLNHGLLRMCEYCLIDHTASEDLHIIFILHGYKANPQDMKKVVDFITLTYPHVKCVLIHKCYSQASRSIRYLATEVVDEILTNLRLMQEKESRRRISRISFIAHSVGGLVFRLALYDSRLEPYKPFFHFFLSLNVPHLGVLFSTYTTEIGARLLNFFNGSMQLEELLLEDAKDRRDTILYEMSKNTGLDNFKFIYFFSSHQDTYIPFYSERVELSPQIEQSTKDEAQVIKEMINNFWSELRCDHCRTVVKKFDVDFDQSKLTLESLIGRTAHMYILKDVDMIYTLLLKIEQCFSK